MNKAELRVQLKPIYSIMSIGEYRTALKMAFEMLLYVASQDAETKETEFEKKSLFEVIRLLFDFFVNPLNMFKNVDYLLEDFIVLGVYFDSINRESNTKELFNKN